MAFVRQHSRTSPLAVLLLVACHDSASGISALTRRDGSDVAVVPTRVDNDMDAVPVVFSTDDEVVDMSILSVDGHGNVISKLHSKPNVMMRNEEANFVQMSQKPADPALSPAASSDTSSPNFTVRQLVTLASCATLLAALSWLGVAHAPGSMAAMFYLCVSVAIDACIATSHVRATSATKTGSQSTFAFNPLCNIILVELGKLVVSIALFAKDHIAKRDEGKATGNFVTGMMVSSMPSDVGFMAVPAACYTLNNILVFIAIGNNEVATFAAFRETMILWTALIWTAVFKVPLGWKRIGAILTIVFGLVLNQAAPLMHATFSWAVLLVFSMALANASGSVCNEYALKRISGVDLNLQNIHLYSWCFGLGVVTLAATDHTKLLHISAFFQGFDGLTFTIVTLQLAAGLLVSRILKYTSSVQKTMVASLRGPVLVVLSPLLALPSRTDPATLLSAVIVGASACFFLMQGKPQPPEPQPVTES